MNQCVFKSTENKMELSQVFKKKMKNKKIYTEKEIKFGRVYNQIYTEKNRIRSSVQRK